MVRWCKRSLLISLGILYTCGPINDEVPPPEETAIPTSRTPIQVQSVEIASQLDCSSGTKLNYTNFGEAFLLTHCTSCHSSSVPTAIRGGAPDYINFDTASDVINWLGTISNVASADDGSMPPANTVSGPERQAFSEWLNCGAPDGLDRIQSQ